MWHPPAPMRICLVYDCLYPHTIGGAERWYRDIGRRLSHDGHEVTYLTLRQWGRGENGDFDGVRVLAVGPRMELYVRGRRRVLPPLVYGAGVLLHLLRHGRRYDVVHAASFPYFSLLAAGLARRRSGYRLFVDWHEVWTRGYWAEYLGRVAGWIGWRVQRLCLRIPQLAFCPSRLQDRRLREEGFGGKTAVLDGRYDGSLEPARAGPAEELVVFAGRHIPEKQAPAAVPAIAEARERLPGLRGIVFGDGPDRPEVLRLIEQLGLERVVDAPGFVAGEQVEGGMARALCLLFPSRREGYGLVVIEAAHRGTPTIAVREPDNAATELIEDGRNGFVAPSATAGDLAAAIVRVHEAGPALRESTADWFNENAERLSLATSLDRLAESYRAESVRS
jgi:glycosyltransferase involved in cell wall biosynthesis